MLQMCCDRNVGTLWFANRKNSMHYNKQNFAYIHTSYLAMSTYFRQISQLLQKLVLDFHTYVLTLQKTQIR